MKRSLVTVVIHAHLPEPEPLEKISLAQTLNVLGRHPITFVVPAGLDTRWYEDFCRGRAAVRFMRFEWSGLDEYARMLLSPTFYARFHDYRYLLICHLDAFVFRDELTAWCHLGHDYVGAVIHNRTWDRGLQRSLGQPAPYDTLHKLLRATSAGYLANGGFGLRKVDAFLRMTRRFERYIDLYTAMAMARGRGVWEDLFVLRHFPRMSRDFSVPPRRIAARFGAEHVDEVAPDLRLGQRDVADLPFGIHGWIQFQPEVWKPYVRRFGHAV
jgi:hypothetical protein